MIKRKRIKTVLTLAVMAMAIFLTAGSTRAGTISYAPITGDADSGISTDNTYTHAIDFGNQPAGGGVATVNGVIFANGSAGSFPAIGGSSQTVGTGSSTIPNNHSGNNGADAYLTAGGMRELVYDMIYNDGTAVIELTGLTSGRMYKFRLYHREWGGGSRSQDIGFDTDGVGTDITGAEDTAVFYEDDATQPDPSLDIIQRVYAFTYEYALSPGVTTLTVYINMTGTGTYHLYGLTNEVSNFPKDPSPDIGGFVHPGNVDLGWTNADPTSGDSVRVEVWFGMDPNLIRITDPNLSEAINMTTKTVDAPVPGTYYWRVNSYLDGVVHAESKAIGPLWWFIAKEDLLPVVDAGVDMITWQNQAVTLDPIIDDDEVSPLTFRWTAPSEPDVIVVFSDPNTLAPTVTITITKPFNNPFVGNPGFEDPVLADGAEWEWDTSVWVEADYILWLELWDYGDDDYTSTYNPTIAADGFEAPEGENVAVVYTYTGYDYALTQILAETLQASTRYDLSVQVGNPGPYNEYVSLDYRVELWTGGNVGDRSFLYGSGEQTIDPNGWETVNLTYACGPNHEQLGEPLEIRLIAESYADGHKVYFDDVILSIDGKSGTFPAHHSVDLTLAVNDEDNPTPVEDTMTIDVYANACMAAISAGADDPGDIDEDCMTNLKDIAEIAAAWLDVYSVTAPFEKP